MNFVEDDSMDSLKKDASQSLIQLLETAAKDAEKRSNPVYDKPNDFTIDIDNFEPNKIREEVAEQMFTSSLACFVCKRECVTENELSQHLQVRVYFAVFLV
jgi:hypothetical protein